MTLNNFIQLYPIFPIFFRHFGNFLEKSSDTIRLTEELVLGCNKRKQAIEHLSETAPARDDSRTTKVKQLEIGNLNEVKS